ncbi:MAG: type II toxin-antitoxin system ParD family antitoxin [Sterolibacterium sp.]|nr:type II toxin-antitoxin system ParD family antitoxin [Sterolibacterium sp.]MBP9800900.1 type II toxin-antitoxin system ParD family antitoxin [Sterolibacterium sp.]
MNKWIKAHIAAGHYTNDSEYIRDLIRPEQECSLEMEAIRTALIEGKTNEEPRHFDAMGFKRKMRSAHG